VKTKPRDHVQVVQDTNDEATTRDDVFKLNEFIDPYRVVSFTNLVQASLSWIKR